MALATRCPNCQALFRVAPDQLKLRGGVVRCGSCRHVFDAIGTLSYLDDAALTTTATASPPAAVDAVIAAIRKAESTVGDAMPQDDASTSDEEPSVEEISAATAERREGTFDLSDATEGPVATEPNDALIGLSEERRPTQVAEPEAEAPARGDAAAADVETAWTQEPAPIAGSDEPGAEAAKPVPSFLSNSAAPRKRGSRMPLGAAAALLALLALAQLAVAFRSDIVAVLPQARPALGQLCRLFRCTVGWPTRADLLAVVGTELQLLPGASALELTAIVRNRGPMTLELPAIELTLSDTLNRTVARRIFTPLEYLAGDADPRSRIEAGLAAGADLTVRVAFEARGIKAAGFVVYPFYL
jgi:predicted Zn finger-like uncharacterized protein